MFSNFSFSFLSQFFLNWLDFCYYLNFGYFFLFFLRSFTYTVFALHIVFSSCMFAAVLWTVCPCIYYHKYNNINENLISVHVSLFSQSFFLLSQNIFLYICIFFLKFLYPLFFLFYFFPFEPKPFFIFCQFICVFF